MRFLHENPTTLCFLALLAATMMPGGLFLRRTSAFVLSRTPPPRTPTFARRIAANSRQLQLQIRGGSSGSNYHYASPRLPNLARPATLEEQQTTTTPDSCTTDDDNDDSSSIIEREAESSLSIVGSAVTMDRLLGVPFLNTKDSNEFRVLFVLGGPGAGKGTQSDLLKENYPCVHLSAGQLLREEVQKEDSPHRELIETCLVSGNIVPVEISLALLENAMREAALEHGKEVIFLVDGFPRNFDNLNGWIRCMSSPRKSVASVWGVLNYICPLEELERRIMQRAQDGSGRSDDNLQSARKRFGTFERETMPVVETLRQVEAKLEAKQQPSLRVFDIRADQSIDNVWKETQRAMDRMISYDVLTAQSQLMHAIDTNDANLYRQVCADEWFDEEEDYEEEDDEDNEKKSIKEIMTLQEQTGAGTEGFGDVSNLKLSYISGTKVAIEYDRIMGDNNNKVKITEKRIWSHQGTKGWKNIHFARLPAAAQ